MDKIDKMISRMIDYALEHPEDAPNSILIVHLSKGGMEKILTPARMEILNVIKDEKPKTVGELVRILKRPKESVSRDLTALSNYGLISFVKSGTQKAPKIEKEIIAMQLIN